MRKMCIATATILLGSLALAIRPALATASGTNGRISFARYFPSTNSTSLFSVRVDGSGEVQLTCDKQNHVSEVSNWSPDGSHIIFDSDRLSNGAPDIVDIFVKTPDGVVVNSGGSCDDAALPLTLGNAGFNGEPEYSPSGTTIAFESDRGTGAEGIYLMASDGSNIRRVTVAPAGFYDAFPQFSPSGSRLAFTRASGCRPNRGINLNGGACLAAVFLVNLNGSGLTRITPWGWDTAATDWSPDGSKLVFESRIDTVVGSKTDVLVVNLNGLIITNLTNNPPFIPIPPCSISDNAKFSPDGTRLVFRHTDCVGDDTLWMMNPDGSGKQDTGVGLGPGGEGFAAWGTSQN